MGTLLHLCVVAALFCLSMQRSVAVAEKADSTHARMAGREFVISFLQNGQKSWLKYTQYKLFISTVRGKATVKVRAPSAKFQRTITLRPLQSVAVDLPPNIELFDSRKSSITVLVDATADVSITSFSYKKSHETAETSVVYPTKSWGTEYLIFTPSASPTDKYKEFSVTNGKESNKIELYLQGHARFEGKWFQKGRKLVVNLQPYQALQIQSLWDLTNTRIVSQKPVAVVTGHTCTKRFANCNHVYEQLLPVSGWGTNIIVPPIYFQSNFDSVYIQASQDTTVKIISRTSRKTIRMTSWSIHELRHKFPNALFIQANHGIQVFFLFNGKKAGRNQFYNSFLINMLSTEYFCSSYLLLPLPGLKNQALIVANKDAARKMKFPSYRGQWIQTRNTDFLWMNFSVKLRYNQILSSSGSPFGLYSFGVGSRNGYGYGSAGHCVKPE